MYSTGTGNLNRGHSRLPFCQKDSVCLCATELGTHTACGGGWGGLGATSRHTCGIARSVRRRLRSAFAVGNADWRLCRLCRYRGRRSRRKSRSPPTRNENNVKEPPEKTKIQQNKPRSRAAQVFLHRTYVCLEKWRRSAEDTAAKRRPSAGVPLRLGERELQIQASLGLSLFVLFS